ncbi:heme/copper-type cytochrome/quinol oxidase subunit 1 [Pseudarthrobacter oxydans]|uniref:hypothetical protein n=1 Tax=Pseudarthrobacter oxydans TaxID=1671 RepID=UPI0027855844|nr:hypothetical protein [Pseudarthrobacter oxydans]MDP9982525.1 heme/copper-type cytochrome/quinol oxidase subunit 1 [Pseudarthrobacter oxydans]
MNPSSGKESGPSRQRRLIWLAGPLLGAVLLAAGAVFLSLPGLEEFGWFAYAPLSRQTFAAPGLLVMDAEKWAGVVLVGLGLLTLAFWSGVLAGRHSRRPPADAG